MQNKAKLVPFIAGMLLALALMFSCSSVGGSGIGPDGGLGSGPHTETYQMLNIDAGSFTFKYVEEEEISYYCNENGLQQETHGPYENDVTLYYSINNTVLTLENMDNLRFNGNQNTLTGTWTRNKNVAESCNLRQEQDSYYSCNNGYNITRMVITSSTIAITSDVCETERIVNGSVDEEGWRITAVDCNTVEYSKEAQKVRYYFDNLKRILTYNNKTCTRNRTATYSRSAHENACQRAIAKYQQSSGLYSWCVDDFYYDILHEDFEQCLKDNSFPESFLGDDADRECY